MNIAVFHHDSVLGFWPLGIALLGLFLLEYLTYLMTRWIQAEYQASKYFVFIYISAFNIFISYQALSSIQSFLASIAHLNNIG